LVKSAPPLASEVVSGGAEVAAHDSGIPLPLARPRGQPRRRIGRRAYSAFGATRKAADSHRVRKIGLARDAIEVFSSLGALHHACNACTGIGARAARKRW
jgi:hypothetical protein